MKYSENLLAKIQKATFHASDINSLDFDSVNNALVDHSFAIIRGLIEPEVIQNAVKKIKNYHNAENDNPATGEAPEELMDNFQKLSIGGAEHSGVYRPRCMRTFYNPIWADDVFGMKKAFVATAQIRNLLYGFETNYAIETPENNFWTASRIHNYPKGGGFLVSHVDNIVPSVQSKSKLSNQYFQPVIVMSKKGTGNDCDFETGGGFFEVDGERFYYESECELGDIIIYSGLTVHGVEDIDLEKTFDSRTAEGRFAGFVTLYKQFKRKNEVKDYLKS